MRSQQENCFALVHGSRWTASARAFGPWPECSHPAVAGLRWRGVLQVEAADTKFCRALQHLIRDRCCTSLLRPPSHSGRSVERKLLLSSTAAASADSLTQAFLRNYLSCQTN